MMPSKKQKETPDQLKKRITDKHEKLGFTFKPKKVSAPSKKESKEA